MGESNILKIEDPEYRGHVVNYVLKYHRDLIEPNHRQLLTPTIHVQWLPSLEDLDNTLPQKVTVQEMTAHGNDPLGNRERFDLNSIDLSPWIIEEEWPGYGWMNFNFVGRADEMRFVIVVCNSVLKEHHGQVCKNSCPHCGRLRRTPKANVCMWCCVRGSD